MKKLGVGPDNFRTGAKAIILSDAKENDNVIIKNHNNVILDRDNLPTELNTHAYLQSFNADGSLKYTARYKHAHNEWLNILAENGFLGFLLLVSLFVLPFKIFLQNLNHSSETVKSFSYCGIMLISSYAIYSQTQSIFAHHSALIFFLFFLLFFVGQISKYCNRDENHDSV